MYKDDINMIHNAKRYPCWFPNFGAGNIQSFLCKVTEIKISDDILKNLEPKTCARPKVL